MKNFKRYIPFILILPFFVFSYYSFSFGDRLASDNNLNNELKVIFLDVGQGDAIYIEAPNKRQVLIDGGSDRNILPKLVKYMPSFDNSIDLIINTNPDKDHVGGLVEVIKNYEISYAIESGTTNDTLVFNNFKNEIKNKDIPLEKAKKDMKIILDEEHSIYLEIIFPDRDVTNFERNDGSVVSKLVYKDVSFMLMGDATKYTENMIRWNYPLDKISSNVLKLGHHGSDTSSSLYWLELVDPEVAIISAGKNNSYGHPKESVINNLNSLGIPYLGTYDLGDIIFSTDGYSLNY